VKMCGPFYLRSYAASEHHMKKRNIFFGEYRNERKYSQKILELLFHVHLVSLQQRFTITIQARN
jgi:hypothetical protein